MANPNASAKFKKKQPQVDAVSVTLILTAKPADHPQWVVDAFAVDRIRIEGSTLVIQTPDGTKTAGAGDMLCMNERGWLFPMKAAEFNSSYEAV